MNWEAFSQIVNSKAFTILILTGCLIVGTICLKRQVMEISEWRENQ